MRCASSWHIEVPWGTAIGLEPHGTYNELVCVWGGWSVNKKHASPSCPTVVGGKEREIACRSQVNVMRWTSYQLYHR